MTKQGLITTEPPASSWHYWFHNRLKLSRLKFPVLHREWFHIRSLPRCEWQGSRQSEFTSNRTCDKPETCSFFFCRLSCSVPLVAWQWSPGATFDLVRRMSWYYKDIHRQRTVEYLKDGLQQTSAPDWLLYQQLLHKIKSQLTRFTRKPHFSKSWFSCQPSQPQSDFRTEIEFSSAQLVQPDKRIPAVITRAIIT